MIFGISGSLAFEESGDRSQSLFSKVSLSYWRFSLLENRSPFKEPSIFLFFGEQVPPVL